MAGQSPEFYYDKMAEYLRLGAQGVMVSVVMEGPLAHVLPEPLFVRNYLALFSPGGEKDQSFLVRGGLSSARELSDRVLRFDLSKRLPFLVGVDPAIDVEDPAKVDAAEAYLTANNFPEAVVLFGALVHTENPAALLHYHPGFPLSRVVNRLQRAAAGASS